MLKIVLKRSSIILGVLILFSCVKQKKETIIFPENFSGYSVIFYSQNKNLTSYEITPSGIILKIDSNITFVDFNSEDYKDVSVILEGGNDVQRQNIRTHSGSIFVPDKVDYLVHYINNDDTYLDFESLKKAYYSKK